MNRLKWLLLVVLVVASRFFDLTNKPLHFDEAINGWFVMQMQVMGFYKYDPTNYHGPLYFYLLQTFELFFGKSVATLRLLPAAFSALSVLVVALPFFGSARLRTWISGLLLFSTSFLFFGRSGIHEMPFVFFQILLAIGVLRWFERKDSLALALAAAGLWGMMLLKETFAVSLIAGGLALLSLGVRQLADLFSWRDLQRAFKKIRFFLVLLLLSFVFYYTGFLRNLGGLSDFFKALLPWLQTGTSGAGHEKEFLYWVKSLYEAEPVVLLGVGAALAGTFHSHRAWRFISVFALTQFFIYSLIPYKTIWCVLTLVWPFYFSLGYFVLEVYARYRRAGVATALIVVLISVPQGLSTYRSVYARPIDMAHPYVYVNSTYEFKDFSEFLAKSLEDHPDWSHEVIQVGMKEQWPWPWTLRDHSRLDYTRCDHLLQKNALIYLCDLEDREKVESQLQEPYLRVPIHIRQSRGQSWIYMRAAEFENEYPETYMRIEPGAEEGSK